MKKTVYVYRIDNKIMLDDVMPTPMTGGRNAAATADILLSFLI